MLQNSNSYFPIIFSQVLRYLSFDRWQPLPSQTRTHRMSEIIDAATFLRDNGDSDSESEIEVDAEIEDLADNLNLDEELLSL